jgi:predicted dehydrogenase
VLSVENRRQTTLLHGDAAGMHQDRLDFSFPQRLRDAFAAEIAHVVRVFRGEATWPVCVSDCVAAQSIAMAASRLAKTGDLVPIDSGAWSEGGSGRSGGSGGVGIVVRALGNGSFGSYIRQLVSEPGAVPGLQLLETFTRTAAACGALDYRRDVLSGRSGVDAVYIRSPDVLHQQQALDCLAAGKHVLVWWRSPYTRISAHCRHSCARPPPLLPPLVAVAAAVAAAAAVGCRPGC